jgi:hypothetical protein
MIEDAVRFYNDLLDDNLATETWSQLVAAMKTRHLAFGDRLLCTVLRPHFLTEADYATLQGECALILSAFRKAYHALMADRSFRAQMDLTPAEETVIAYDPGFDLPHPLSRLDSFYSHADQTLHFVEYNGETPAGAGYEDVLAETFLELPVMQHFQQRYRLRPVPVRGEVLQTLLAMYRQWGRRDRPTIGIIDWRGVPTTEEFHIFQEYFERQGYHAVIAPPEEVEYRAGVLVASGVPVQIVYKRVLAGELLDRYGLDHPLIYAVRDHAVCMVNPFRAKILHKKMSFAILSDEENQHLYSSEERRAIAAHIPWTRKVAEGKTRLDGREIDLVPTIVEYKDRFVLKPNDEYGGKGVVIGWETSPDEWARAVQRALQEPYVVQARVNIAREDFPTLLDGRLHVGERLVDLDPYLFWGETVHGCLTRLSATTLLNVTAGSGSVVPTFVIEES